MERKDSKIRLNVTMYGKERRTPSAREDTHISCPPPPTFPMPPHYGWQNP